MKKTMRFLCLAALALVGAMMTGCSNEDDFTVEPENKSNVVTLTTTVGIGGGAETRALAADGVKTFAAGETMAVIYKNTSGATVKAVSEALTASDIQSGSDDKTATFTFTLENPNKGENVTYIYPAAMASTTDVNYAALNSQDGSLTTLSSNLDLATYTGAWNGTSLPSATLTNQLAFLAVTLKNADGSNDITSSITNMTINDGSNHPYTISRSAAAGPIYVAIRPTTSANIWVTATTGSKEYGKSLSSKTYAAGNGYNVTWRMMKELTTVTWDERNVINDDNEEKYVIKDVAQTYEGITLSCIGNGNSWFFPGEPAFQVVGSDYFTFTAPAGRQFTKIEIENGKNDVNLAEQDNWTKTGNNIIWSSNTPSDEVNLRGTTTCNYLKRIVFTLMDE